MEEREAKVRNNIRSETKRELRPKMDKSLQKVLVVGTVAEAAQSQGTWTPMLQKSHNLWTEGPGACKRLKPRRALLPAASLQEHLFTSSAGTTGS